MMMTLTLVDEDLQPLKKIEKEFSTPPVPNEKISIMLGGVDMSFTVLTVGGLKDDGKYNPTHATLQRKGD